LRATRLYNLLCLSNGWSVIPLVWWLVCWSVHLSICLSHFTFLFCGFWHHCSCPNDLLTSITAPTHLHATGVAVYLALFSTNRPKKVKDELKICFIVNWLAEMQILAIIAHLWPVLGLLRSRHQCSTLSKTIPWNPTLGISAFKRQHCLVPKFFRLFQC